MIANSAAVTRMTGQACRAGRTHPAAHQKAAEQGLLADRDENHNRRQQQRQLTDAIGGLINVGLEAVHDAPARQPTHGIADCDGAAMLAQHGHIPQIETVPADQCRHACELAGEKRDCAKDERDEKAPGPGVVAYC